MAQLPNFCARLSVPFALAIALASGLPHAMSAQAPGTSPTRRGSPRGYAESGVRGADFERYFADSVAGPVNRHVPGVRAYLMKGSGARASAGTSSSTIRPLERRNEYFPKPDSTPSGGAVGARAPGAGMEALAKYVDIAAYTDYVIVR